MSESEITEANAILLWAEKLANKHELGINIIVDSFVKARDASGSVEDAKAFIENEIKSIRRGGANE